MRIWGGVTKTSLLLAERAANRQKRSTASMWCPCGIAGLKY